MAAEWKTIEAFPDYEMSRGGDIRWADTKERVELTHNGRGLKLVWLDDERGKPDLRIVSKLYSEVFDE